MLEYPSEQLQAIYEKLPEDLQEAIFSEETAGNIFDICEKNRITEDQKSGIARYAGYVLLGILAPGKFQETLEKELELSVEQAGNIARETTQLIFLPVKESLKILYPEEIIASEEKPEAAEEKSAPLKKENHQRLGPDNYREPIE